MSQEKTPVNLGIRMEKRKYQIFRSALAINQISLQKFLDDCIDKFLDERPEFKKTLTDEEFGKK